jgi:hypothetical protein
MYCHQTNDVIDVGPRPLPKNWRNISGLDKASASELKSWGWLPVVYVNEVYAPATRVRTGPTGCNIGDAVPAGADEVTGAYALRDKTQQEVDDDKRDQDLATLREAGKDLALVLTELVEWALANTAMQPTDFTPDTKQRYLDVKAIADRVK